MSTAGVAPAGDPAARRSAAPVGATFKAYVYFGLLLVSGALQRPIGGDTLHRTMGGEFIRDSNIKIQLVGVVFYAITGLLFLLNFRRIRLAPGLWPLLVLTVLAPASATWSADPISTLTRSFGLVGCTLFALVTASRIGTAGVLKILGNFAAGFIFANLLLALALPGYTHHGAHEVFGVHAGALKGTYVHKNSLARVLSLCLIAVVCIAPDPKRRTMYILAAAVGVFLLLQTHSAKTFISVPVSVLSALLLASTSRPLPRITVLAVGSACGAAILFGGGGELILGAVGRDPTLSARTVIWGAAINAAMAHPILGGGYEATWNHGIGAAVRVAAGFDSTHAHNGFIQTFIDLGVVGLAIVLAFLTWTVVALVRMPLRGSVSSYRFCAAWMVMFMINNYAGAYLMQTSDIYWYFLILTPFMLEHAKGASGSSRESEFASATSMVRSRR